MIKSQLHPQNYFEIETLVHVQYTIYMYMYHYSETSLFQACGLITATSLFQPIAQGLKHIHVHVYDTSFTLIYSTMATSVTSLIQSLLLVPSMVGSSFHCILNTGNETNKMADCHRGKLTCTCTCTSVLNFWL